MQLNQMEIHKMVEYIRAVGVEFDAADVEEDVEGVLWQYGFCDSLSDEDLGALRQELMPLGVERQAAEVVRLVCHPGQASGISGEEREYVVEGDIE